MMLHDECNVMMAVGMNDHSPLLSHSLLYHSHDSADTNGEDTKWWLKCASRGTISEE
jgi:hypothetical protein